MFNASELEGEVDHSFFDSDCDNSTRDGGEKTEKGLKAKKQSPAAHQRSPAKDTESTNYSLSPRKERTDEHLKQVEKNKRRGVSAVSHQDKITSDKNYSEDDSNVHSKRTGGTFLALLADVQAGDDVYNQSTNEMEEKAISFTANQKKRNEQSSRKLMKSRHTRNSSPSSAEASADADSESSCSSRRSNLGSTLPKPTKSSSHPGGRRTRTGSSGSRDVLNSSTDESDDTVTDVSPLSSPESSRLQSLGLDNSEVEEGSHEEQQESVPSSGLSNVKQAEDSYEDMDDERSFSLESQLGHKLVLHPGRRYRKNYSFTNDEVRRIDRENQRLLRELSRRSPGSRPGSSAEKKIHVASNTPQIRLCHSALNRKREQQRIERENLAFLKRLESVKPTQGLSRSEQLADYQRQMKYLGHSPCPVHRSTTKKERVSSRISSASTGHRTLSTGAVSSSDSSSTPLPRSKNLNAARPAW